MLHEMGDSTFLIGDVGTTSYRDLMGHETVRALAIASNLDAQPDCVNCTYQPYCGVCPVHNHRTQGTIFGRMRESSLCAVHKGIQDHLFASWAVGQGGHRDPEEVDDGARPHPLPPDVCDVEGWRFAPIPSRARRRESSTTGVRLLIRS